MSTLKFKHVGVAVPSIDEALATYRAIFGYEVLSGPITDPGQHVTVCFLGKAGSGEPTIELVAPAGENSPVDKFLTKGITAYHLCYEVEDIEKALEHVRSKGCVVIGQPIPATAFEGRRIAWFYTPLRQLMELVER